MAPLVDGVKLAAALCLSCSDKDQLEQLQRDNQSLQAEVKAEQRKVAEAETREKILKDRFDFLAREIQGTKARIVTNMGVIECEFYPEKAPLHCFNFITRAECGFYDGTLFHRVIKNFMIQGGDPLSKDHDPSNDGTGGPVLNIPHEFNDSDLKHA